MATIIPPALDPSHLAELAEQAVRRAARGGAEGRDRHRVAVAELARLIDTALVWPPTPLGIAMEALDGLAAKLILGAIVKHAFQRLREAGEV